MEMFCNVLYSENEQVCVVNNNAITGIAAKIPVKNTKQDLVSTSAAREEMLKELPILMLAEEALIAAAIHRLDDHIRGRLRHAMAFQLRCAMIGDTEGVITSDELIESLICEAAGEPQSASELKAMKQPFKDAWRTNNSLRDMKPDVNQREQMVAFILAGDEAGAISCVRRFYASIGQRI
jgi:DNA-binding GntR family transcriptional regulator